MKAQSKNEIGKTVEKFIKNFTQFGKQVRECFTQGNCYYFALILKDRFNGDIMYNEIEGHFACRIKRKLYDITGCCDNLYVGDWISWENYKIVEPNRSKGIIRDCILKDNLYD